MTAPVLEARFKGRLGAFDLDAGLTIAAKGVTALVGPSGCGKTTVLRCIAGLTRLPGHLVVGGEVWQDERVFRPVYKRPIGFVFQEASLLPHLSVRQNLLFGYRRRGASTKITFDEAVSLLALGGLLGRAPAKLSGGERQRVAIGRALLSQPDLLLMDEPLSSLDVDAKAEILAYISRLHEALAAPVIYVTHDPGEVAQVAGEILTMRAGKVELRE